jgi:hypothetical protein
VRRCSLSRSAGWAPCCAHDLALALYAAVFTLCSSMLAEDAIKSAVKDYAAKNKITVTVSKPPQQTSTEQ